MEASGQRVNAKKLEFFFINTLKEKNRFVIFSDIKEENSDVNTWE